MNGSELCDSPPCVIQLNSLAGGVLHPLQACVNDFIRKNVGCYSVVCGCMDWYKPGYSTPHFPDESSILPSQGEFHLLVIPYLGVILP